MEWPAQSSDWNPVENLWANIKKGVYTIKPTSNKYFGMQYKKSETQFLPIDAKT